MYKSSMDSILERTQLTVRAYAQALINLGVDRQR